MHTTARSHLPAQLPHICLIITAVLSLNLQSNYKTHVFKLCEEVKPAVMTRGDLGKQLG